MKIADWKELAELIGIVAIVASLLFVGLQLKQGHEIALATQYHSRAETAQNLHLAGIESDWTIPVLRDKVSDEVSTKDINLWLWFWIQMDNHYYQFQAGFLGESAWLAQLKNIEEAYSYCKIRFVYEWRSKGLRPEFVEVVESLADPCLSTN
jgi:hypothetical protein